jgi:hypothetical protein
MDAIVPHAGGMAVLGTSATGPVPPDEVWERYARPGAWSSWAPQIRQVDAAERLAEGAVGRVHGVLGVSADFVVTGWDEDAREWSWTAHGRLPLGVPGPTLHLEHGVEPAGAGTRTWLRVTGALPWVTAYLPTSRLALHRLVH